MSKKSFVNNHAYDAVIAGGGPAGSTAAYILASKGLRVLLLDKTSFPRSKLCGGLLTRKTIQVVKRIFNTNTVLLQNRGIIHYLSRDYLVGNPKNSFIQGKLDYPFHFVDREKYDYFWLKMAQTVGVEIRCGEKVVAVKPDRNRVMTEAGKEYRGRFILGADGANSRVRQSLIRTGHLNSDWNSGLATALEVSYSKNEAPHIPDFPVIYYGYIPWGYAWSFPGLQHHVLGIAGLNKKAGRQLKARLSSFLNSMGLDNNKAADIKSHPLPYGNFLNQPGYEAILLLGDAAGLVDPLLGEGIYYAHRSGELAALAILASFSKPQSALLRYTDNLGKFIYPELKYAKIGSHIAFSLPQSCYYRIYGTLLKTFRKTCEETIQGQRSFRWFQPIQKN